MSAARLRASLRSLRLSFLACYQEAPPADGADKKPPGSLRARVGEVIGRKRPGTGTTDLCPQSRSAIGAAHFFRGWGRKNATGACGAGKPLRAVGAYGRGAQGRLPGRLRRRSGDLGRALSLHDAWRAL